MKGIWKHLFLVSIVLSILYSSINTQGGEENINDPTLYQEEEATGMEDVGNDDLEGETLARNQIEPNEEEEIDNAMNQENPGGSLDSMFGGGQDGEMIKQMGLEEPSHDSQGHHEHGGEHIDPAVEEYFNEEEANNGHEQIDHEISEENLDHEQEYQGEDEIPGDQIIDHGLIALDHHTELEKMKNFKKISDDCKIFLEEFRDCLDNIPDAAWDNEEIQKCVGKDYTRVVNNICKWRG